MGPIGSSVPQKDAGVNARVGNLKPPSFGKKVRQAVRRVFSKDSWTRLVRRKKRTTKVSPQFRLCSNSLIIHSDRALPSRSTDPRALRFSNPSARRSLRKTSQSSLLFTSRVKPGPPDLRLIRHLESMHRLRPTTTPCEKVVSRATILCRRHSLCSQRST